MDKVTLSHIQNKETWKNLTTICKIIPDNDVLPVRSTYNPDSPATNIGINYVKSEDDTSLWYTLPDLIASKQLSGKTPKILDAITFYPQGVQSGLQPIEILKGIPLESQENFIKKLIEERIQIKSDIKNKKDNSDYKDSIETKQDDINQNILKIIANATSYGIFIQINSTPEKKEKEVTVYGLDKFDTESERTEEPAEYFNPIMSVFLTACSRLILSTAETLVKKNKGQVFYFDTDSIFLTPEHVELVQDFFQPLNPYDVDVKMFKVEEDEDHNLLHDKLFYGISAKRYVLYERDDTSKKITIYKYSAHGLGHLLDPFVNNNKKDKEDWNENIWQDILTIQYNPESKDTILEKYQEKFAISQMSASTVDILNRFDKFNEEKAYKNKVKPFNFATVGTGWKKDPETDEPVIPFLPYADEKKKQDVPYMKFVDYKTGKIYPNKDFINTEEFWKPLSEVIRDYVEHKESKSDGNIGELKRKHLLINRFSIRYIGKESNELEESDIVGVTDGNYAKYLNLREVILEIDVYKEHKKIGVSKSNLFELQKKAKNNEKIKPQKETLMKILNYVKNR